MDEQLMHLIQVKRAWTEAAKCAEKEGSIVAADYARHLVKAYTKMIVKHVAVLANGPKAEGGAA